MTNVRDRLADVTPVRVVGRISRVVGLEAEARGLRAAIGDMVLIDGRLSAQVVAINDERLMLAPYGGLDGLAAGATVQLATHNVPLRVGPALLGRVIDAMGRPIDGGPLIDGEVVDVDNAAPHPLRRRRIAEPLPLGVRALDSMTPCGRGQRMGVFAGSGVGKSTLLGMMARGTTADVVVVGLIGERGREVREFLEDDLGCTDNVVTVVATSDEPALRRLRAAYTATRVAEWYRDQGADVLLLVDSLTRFAMAQREIGLAAGEPPATRGYPPSVFAELPKLLERAGPGEKGTITAFYTVLVEGDDMNDPVADHARSILDGHIVLSRRLAAAGHYPTIDVLESTSRLASKICPPERLALSGRLRRLMAASAEAKDLIDIGAYAFGANADVDDAVARRDLITDFLQQPAAVVSSVDETWSELAGVLA